MIHLFIDANVYLRFYAYTDDDLLELEKLHALMEASELRIYRNEQLEDEVERNREKKIDEALKTFKASIGGAQVPRFASHFEEAKALLELSKQIQSAKSALNKKIADEIETGDLRADKLIQQLLELATNIPIDAQVLERARLRQLRGNPPGKSDSIGDQIHWETLLSEVDDEQDLHIVSHDGDFSSALAPDAINPKLSNEWTNQKKSEVFLYKSLGAFVKKHFGSISLPADVTKASAISKLVGSTNFDSTHKQIARLERIFEEITKEDAMILFQAIIDNSQIGWIAEDEDVEDFYKSLYDKFIFETTAEMDNALKNVAPYFDPIPY